MAGSEQNDVERTASNEFKTLGGVESTRPHDWYDRQSSRQDTAKGEYSPYAATTAALREIP